MASVDVRSVVMDFDYAKFIKGVSTTMNTIKQLEKTLNFSKRTTGFDRLQASVQHFDATQILKSIDGINDKFSTMGIVGQEVTRRIANAAMDMASKMSSGITATLNQIKSGGSSRALNLEQARFMLKGLTGDLNKVEQIISGPVNDAVSGTRFGLDQAAVAAANLYASGITGSQELTRSLQAISGAATMTNREYGEMADIFATIKSNGKLMTMQLRQFSSMGMNVSAALAESLGKSEQEINEMVTDGKISYDQFVDVMYKYWDLAADANSTYAGSLANVNAQLSKIGEVVATKYYSSMIKVNTALIDFLKAIKLELDPLYKMINGAIDGVTSKLSDFIKAESTLKSVQNVIKGVTNIAKGLQNIFWGVGQAFDDAFPKSKTSRLLEFSKSFKKATKSFKDWTSLGEGGEWLKSAKSQKKYSDQLHEIIGRYKDEKKIVKESLGIKSKRISFTKDEIKKIKESTTAYEKETEAQRKNADKRQKTVSALDKLVKKYDLKKVWDDNLIKLDKEDAALVEKKLKLTDATSGEILDQVKAYKKRATAQQEDIANRDKTSKQLHDILKRYKAEKTALADKIVYEEKDAQHIENAFNGRAKTMKQLDKEMRRYDKLAKSHEALGSEMARSDTNIGKLINIFNGLFSVVRVGSEIFNGFKLAIEPVVDRLKAVGEAALTIGSTVGVKLAEFNNAFLKSDVIMDFAEKVRTFLDVFLPTSDEIRDWGNKVSEYILQVVPSFDQVSNVFSTFGDRIKFVIRAIGTLVQSIADIDGVSQAFDLLHTILSDIGDGIVNVIGGMFADFGDQRGELFGFAEASIEHLVEGFQNMYASLKEVGGNIAKVFKKMLKTVNLDFTLSLTNVIDLITLFASGKITKRLFDSASNILSKFETWETTFSKFSNSVSNLLKSISGAFNEFTNTLKIGQLLLAALAIGALAGALVTFSFVDADKVELGVTALSSMMLVLMGAMGGLRAMVKDASGIISLSVGFLIMAEGVKVLAKALVKLSLVDPDNMSTALTTLLTTMLAMAKFAGVVAKVALNPASALALIGYVIAIKLLVGSLKGLSKLASADLKGLALGFIALQAMMWSLFGFVAALNAISPTLNVKTPTVLAAYVTVLGTLMTMLLVLMAAVAVDRISGFANLGLAFVMLQAMMWSMFGFVAAMNALAPNLNLKPVIVLGIYMMELGKMVLYLGKIQKMFRKGPEETIAAFVILELMLASLALFTKALSNVTTDVAGTIKGIWGITAICLAVQRMGTAVSVMTTAMDGKYGVEHAVVAFGILEAMLWSLLGFLVAIKKTKVSMGNAPEKTIFELSIVIEAISRMTKILNYIGATIKDKGLTTVGVAFVFLEGIMWSMFGFMAALGAVKPEGALGAIISVIAFTFAVQNLAKTLGYLSKVITANGLVNTSVGFVLLEGIMWSMFGFVAAMNALGPTVNLGAMVSILMLTAAMDGMVKSLTRIAKSINGNGGAAMAGAFVTFELILWSLVGVLAVLNHITMDPVQTALLIASCLALELLAVALTTVTPAIMGLAAIGPAAFIGVAALVAFAAAFMVLGTIASHAPAIIAGMFGIAGGIAAVGASFAVVGVGIAMLGIGLAKFAAGLLGIAKLMKTLTPTLVKDIQKSIPMILTIISSVVSGILKMIVKMAPTIVKAVIRIVTKVIKALADTVADIVKVATDLIVNFCNALAENMPRIVEAAFNLVISFIDGLATSIDKNGPKLRAAIKKLIKAIVKFIVDGAKDVGKAAGKLIPKIKEAIEKGIGKIKEAGRNVIKGFINGFKEKFNDVRDAALSLGSKISGWVRDKLKIKSPSRVFAEIGSYTIAGFINGVKNTMNNAKNQMVSFANGVIGATTKALDEHSPSKVFFKIGAFVVDGFINGVNSKSAAGRKAINKFFRSLGKSVSQTGLVGKSNEKLLDKELNKREKLNKILTRQNKQLNSINKSLRDRVKLQRKSDMTKAEKKELANLEKKNKLTKEEKKRITELRNKEAGYLTARKTTRKFLTNAEKVELRYLQKKLDYEGTLSDKEFRRYGQLLGLSKKQTKALEADLTKRKEINTELDKTEKRIKINQQLIDELEKQLANGHLTNYGFDNSMIQESAKVLQAYGESLYKETEEYKQNTAAIDANNKSIKARKEKIEELKETRRDNNSDLKEEERILKDLVLRQSHRNKLSKTELSTLKALEAKYKSKNKLSEDEWKKLAKLYGWKEKDVKVIKQQYNEMKRLEGRLRENGTLTDEQYLKLAKLYGIKGKNLTNIKAELKVRADLNGALDKTNSKIDAEKDAINELRDSNDELADSIQNGTIEALDNLRNTIKDNISNAINPFQTAISDAIDLVSRFSKTSVDFELPFKVEEFSSEEDLAKAQAKAAKIAQLSDMGFKDYVIEKLKDESDATIDKYLAMTDAEVDYVNHAMQNSLIGNLKSFGDAYREFEQAMIDISAKNFTPALLDRLYALGPEGVNVIRYYAAMTEEEVEQANAAILHSTSATLDQWLAENERKIQQQRDFYANLDILRVNGLSNDAYKGLMEEGFNDTTAAIVDGLLSGTKEQFDRVNNIYADFLTVPDEIANESVAKAAYAAEGVGSALYDGIFGALEGKLMSEEDRAKFAEALTGFVLVTSETVNTVVSEETVEKATNTGEEYVDGMSDGMNNKKSTVKKTGKQVGKAGKKGVEEYLSKSNGAELGTLMDDGLVEGLYSGASRVTEAARAVAAQAYAAAMAELMVASPSKKFIELGKWVDLGFAKGIKDYTGRVTDASINVADSSMDAVQGAIQRLNDIVSGDNMPVIKPILDLSNVEVGAYRMKRMFESAHIGVESDSSNSLDESKGKKEGASYQFIQNNYSPKALSRIDIYRQTKNQFAMLKGATL